MKPIRKSHDPSRVWLRSESIRTLKSGNGARHHLVEDVVRTLKGLLGDDTGLLEQIWQKQELLGPRTQGPTYKAARRTKVWGILTGLDISSSQFTGGSEVDTDEFTLGEKGRWCLEAVRNKLKHKCARESIKVQEFKTSSRKYNNKLPLEKNKGFVTV